MAKKRVKKIQRHFKKSKNYLKYNFVYRNFLFGWDYLKSIRNYIWFSTLLFFLLGIIGFILPVFFVEEIKNLVRELVMQTQGLNTFELVRFIIANNMQSAFYGFILGIFLAVIPLGIIVVNGYVLGFIANKSVGAEGITVLWRLLPHGIFEIPAIMISVALGIKLGMFLFTYHGKDKSQEFWKWLVNSFRAFVFIVIPLLVIAGIIEGILIGLIG